MPTVKQSDDATADLKSYMGTGKLMKNYGWVQNTSNLSTVRDTVELISVEGISHNGLMRKIHQHRCVIGDIKKKWTWDARCRIKAICASGMVELDRNKNGYQLTKLGQELANAPKSDELYKGKRILTKEERNLFRKGILTNPPVIRVLSILNESRKNGTGSLSKYDVGARLGFVGDVGFTHFEAEFVAKNDKSFNDAEGDADKWARTILNWLIQVGWVVKDGSINCYGKPLPRYTTVYEVDRVLQYTVKSTIKYIPEEMLCSDHHPFANIIQQRRISILRHLSKAADIEINDLVSNMQIEGIDTDAQTLSFDILNLQQAGIQISQERSCYKLNDKIKLDVSNKERVSPKNKVYGIEKEIENQVSKYADTIPARLIDNLIRYGNDGTNSAALFEMTVDKLFSFMGYEADYLGQGHGRVADVIAKYRANAYPNSYAIIIDAKAYEKYTFPAGDVRKMKEYINLHGLELLQENIPRHAFALMAFNDSENKLQEIAENTAVNGTAIDVYALLYLGSQIVQHTIGLADLFGRFTTNKVFV